MLRATLAEPFTLRFSRFEKLYTTGFAGASASNINRPGSCTMTNRKVASDGNLDMDERIMSGNFVFLKKSSKVINFLK